LAKIREKEAAMDRKMNGMNGTNGEKTNGTIHVITVNGGD
jgi:hypothetical protein